MLGKLAFRNVIRSAKDYLVYLLTMTFVTALMFSFNTVLFSEQIKTSPDSEGIMEILIGLATFFVVLIVAWLIHYMVRFMLDARYALLISVLLEWWCVSWIGLLIYFFNKLTGKAIGTCMGAFCVLLDICISNDWMAWANRFSPITLAQLNSYTGYNLKYHITFEYGVSFFLIGMLLLTGLSVLANYKDKAENLLKKLEVIWIHRQ